MEHICIPASINELFNELTSCCLCPISFSSFSFVSFSSLVTLATLVSLFELIARNRSMVSLSTSFSSIKHLFSRNVSSILVGHFYHCIRCGETILLISLCGMLHSKSVASGCNKTTIQLGHHRLTQFKK